MSSRHQLKVSGLLQSGKIPRDPNAIQLEEFGAASGAPRMPTNEAQKISTDKIDDSPYQPRIMYDPMEIDNLAHSLAAAGLEDPITVRDKIDGRYELISGHRRVRAARSLGWAEINANIVARSDRDAELATMIQNEARIDLTDYERGKLYQRAQKSGFATTQTEVAHLFGTTQALVSRCMGMLKLPIYFIAILEEKPDLFSYNCAEAITLLIKEYPDEIELIKDGVKRITEEGADQKSVKQWVQQMVKQKRSIALPKERAIITNRVGRAMFAAKFSDREFTVRIQAPEVDAKTVEEMVLAALRQIAAEDTE